MASTSFHSLDPFLPCPGEPPVPFDQWKNTAQAYIRRKEFQLTRNAAAAARNPPADAGQNAPEGDEGGQIADQPAPVPHPPAYSDEEKNLDIFLALGTEGQRQFNGTPDSGNFRRTHAAFMTVLDNLFLTPTNRLISLQKFRHRLQGKDESCTAFAAELRSIAKLCQFPDANVETAEIADTLIVNCYDPEVKQKLFSLSMSHNQRLTIDQVLALMRAEESSKSDIKQLNKADYTAVAGALNKKRQKGLRRVTTQTSPCGDNSKTHFQHNKACNGCGKTGHAYLSDSCPAKNSKCRFCGNLGHWDSVCRKKNSSKGSLGPLSVQPSVSIGSCSSDSRIRCEIFLQTVSGSSRKRHPVSFIADTGAEASTLHESVYKSKFRHIPLQPTDAKLQSVDSSADLITPMGIISLRATFNKRRAELQFYVVSDKCLQLFGINEMAALHMSVDTAKRSVASLSPTSVLSPEALMDSLEHDFPRLFKPGIGKVSDFEHHIQLKPGSVPIRAKMRYAPVSMEADASKAMDTLFEEDVLEKVEKSEYVHPAHFLRKPDHDVRVTVDFSVGVNKHIIPSAHPLPRPQDIFNKVGDDEHFSKMDVPQAYHTIGLAEDSRPLTAFITPSHGLCQFKRLPMGMTDSGATFQRVIEETLCGLEGVHPYCDDIFVHGKTREEHDARLRAACQRLEARGFRLKRSKLLVAQREIPFLGHIISSSASGTFIKPDPKNGAAIAKIRVPTNISEVRSFLGFCNYHSAFIKRYAEISEPLLRLTRKNVRYEWDESCQQAFDVLKDRIMSPEVLAPFNPNLPTLLTTDASDVGLGAALSQLHNGVDRPVAFAAKTLHAAERSYSTPEREALGCVWAAEHFEKFLLGRDFILRTDQNSLKTLMSRFGDNRTSRRISRWYDRLRHFDYTVQHIKGKENVSADILSRLAAELQPSPEKTLPDDDDSLIVASLTSPSSISMEELQLTSSDDDDLKLVRDWLKTSWPPRKQIPTNLRSFFDTRDELSVQDGVIFRQEKLIIPSSLQQRVLNLLHSGHPGIGRMKQKYNEMYFWPGGTSDIERFVRNCVPCSATGKNVRAETVTVTAVTPPTRPWQKVAIDITGPFITAPRHQRHVVVITDYFSKYPEILLTDSVTSGRIITWLKEVFARYGNPEELVSDNGPQFVSSEFKEFLSAKNVLHNLAAVYNPSQNGLVEVFNRSLKNQAQISSVEGSTFKDGMLALLASFRSTAPENGLSPSMLMFGWNLRSDSDIRNTTAFSNGGAVTHSSLPLEERKKSVQKKFEKRRYGRHHGKPKSPYKVGHYVTVKLPPAEVRKGLCPRSPPMRITKVLGRWTYELENGQTWNARKLMRFREQVQQMEDEELEQQHVHVGHQPQQPRRVERHVPVAQPVMPRRTTRVNAGVPPKRLSPSPPLRAIPRRRRRQEP